MSLPGFNEPVPSHSLWRVCGVVNLLIPELLQFDGGRVRVVFIRVFRVRVIALISGINEVHKGLNLPCFCTVVGIRLGGGKL